MAAHYVMPYYKPIAKAYIRTSYLHTRKVTSTQKTTQPSTDTSLHHRHVSFLKFVFVVAFFFHLAEHLSGLYTHLIASSTPIPPARRYKLKDVYFALHV